MSLRLWNTVCFAAATLLFAPAALAQEELKNDGFADGGTAGFQSGFVAGEMAASRFVSPAAGLTVVKVQLLFGGEMNGAKQQIKLHVWDDAALADEPGDELYSGIYELTAADDALQELDLTEGNFVVDGAFRVGVELLHDGLPSVARDSDGTISADKNFLFADGLGWKQSADLGVTGDWILRAFVDEPGFGGSGGAGGTGGAGGSTPTTTSTTAKTTTDGTGGSDGSGGGGGQGGAGTMNGETDGEGCGCRTAGEEPASRGALFVSLAGLFLLATRRRRARKPVTR